MIPTQGEPIVGLYRSAHYNHSGYVDLVIGGLVAFGARGCQMLEVNPLVPADPAAAGFQRYFALENVPYHGQSRLVISRRGRYALRARSGLRVMVGRSRGGEVPNHLPDHRALGLQGGAGVANPINRAVAVVPGQFPRPSASVNADPEGMRTVVDGRVWFFPEVINGWSTAVRRTGGPWLELDLGKDVALSKAELAFFAMASNSQGRPA